jgi:hypothetical protein
VYPALIDGFLEEEARVLRHLLEQLSEQARQQRACDRINHATERQNKTAQYETE